MLKITQTLSGYTIEKGSQVMSLTWGEVWEISRMSNKMQARLDIEEYIEDYGNEMCGDEYGLSVDEIPNDRDMLEQIVEKLIIIRAHNESIDDICSAINHVIKNNWRYER